MLCVCVCPAQEYVIQMSNSHVYLQKVSRGMALDWKTLLGSAVNHDWLKSVTASLKQSQECNSKMIPLIFIFNILIQRLTLDLIWND